jgi:hypothetical protein
MRSAGHWKLFTACAAVVFAGPAWPAQSGLSCTQLFAVVENAVQLRDQGYSLQQVLSGLNARDIEAKLSAEEFQVLRKSVTAVYLGNASAEEIAVACRQARGEK